MKKSPRSSVSLSFKLNLDIRDLKRLKGLVPSALDMTRNIPGVERLMKRAVEAVEAKLPKQPETAALLASDAPNAPNAPNAQAEPRAIVEDAKETATIDVAKPELESVASCQERNESLLRQGRRLFQSLAASFGRRA